MNARLGPIGTARPNAVLPQDAIVDLGVIVAGDEAQRGHVQNLFRRVGVRRRALVVANVDGGSWFYDNGAPPPGTSERMSVYRETAGALASTAARRALERSETDPKSITHLVTASCTGFAAPGVDLEIILSLGLEPTTQRTHIGFMGCHAAVNALRVAAALAETHSNACVLVCCVEVCSIHLQHEDSPERDVVNALFADGAAACVVSSSPNMHTIGHMRSFAARIWPQTAHLMRWDITDTGFRMILDRKVPRCIQTSVRPWITPWLESAGIRLEDIRSWAIHPGGPSVISAVRDGLGLDDSQCTASRIVLEDNGNMSSATLLFVLDALSNGKASGPAVALAFGPGLAGEAMLLELA